METRPNANNRGLFALAILVVLALAATSPSLLPAQTAGQNPAPVPAAAPQPVPQPPGPPLNPAFFPLDQVHPGMTGTAWTVFQGTIPEPMQLEILGVLRGARGPGQDLILARLQGAKPEFTGVVDGMSGSPVYIDGKLVGALSYRIGTFTKEPIAGIPLSGKCSRCGIWPAVPRLPDPSKASEATSPEGWEPAGGENDLPAHGYPARPKRIPP